MTMRLRLSRSSSVTDDESEGWFTRGQLETHYGAKSESLVATLIQRKKAQGLFRLHPELPDIEDATMYWCLHEIRRQRPAQQTQNTLWPYNQTLGPPRPGVR